MEPSRRRTAWGAIAAASVGFLAEAVVASTRDSPLQPVLPAGAQPSGPFAWISRAIGLEQIGSALPAVSVLVVVAAFGGFLVLLRAAWLGEVSFRLAFGLAIAFHVALLFLPLLFSRDVYSYIANGEIVSVHHADPYVATPSAFPSYLTRALVGPKWVDTPSVYGPLFSLLAALVTATTRSIDVLVDAFRLITIGASLATTGVIAATARRARRDRAAFAVAAFGLNPVILFQSVASGHNDLLVALAIAVAAWFVLRDRTVFAAAVLACGALIKATGALPLLLLLIWVGFRRERGDRARAVAAHGAAPIAIAIAAAAPFFQLKDPTLGMLELAGHEGWLAPSRFFRRVLDAVSGDTLGVVARVAFAVGLVLAVVWLVRSVAQRASSGFPREELLAGWGWSLLALTLLGPVLLPWYLAWSLPVIWVLPFVPRAVLIALSGALALSQWTAEPRLYPGAYDVSVLVGHYVLTPVVIGLLVWLAVDLRRRLSIPLALHEEHGEPTEARQGRGGDRDAEVLEP
jgi:alpha-1,6-mannosyltransferase